MGNQYADRDIMGLDDKGGHYFRHVNAMTAEDLHSKSDIAAELAYRDYQIDQLEKRLKNSLEALKYIDSPIKYLREEAEQEGSVLNAFASTIVDDPHFLRDIARKALDKEVEFHQERL